MGLEDQPVVIAGDYSDIEFRSFLLDRGRP